MFDNAVAAIQLATPRYDFALFQHRAVRVAGRALKDGVIGRRASGTEFLK
jgi:hypothetical protein